MTFRAGAGDKILHILSSKCKAKPVVVILFVEMRVNAIFGVYSASLRLTVVRSAPNGNSMRTLPRPIALMLELSAVCTSSASIATKSTNLEWSGQKWDVAPESMMAPREAMGILSWLAMLHMSDVANAYSAVLFAAATFAR